MILVPPFHPEWLVTFWLTTPVLNKIEPHITSLIIVVAIIVLFLYKRKKSQASGVDIGEEQFQHLLNRKRVIEEELKALQANYDEEQITHEQFSLKKKELEKHLEKTTTELKQFTV